MGQTLPDAQPVQMMPRELQGAHPVGQILHLQLVGQGEEGAGDLLVGGEAVDLAVRQDVPDRDKQLAGDGNLGFLRSRLPTQAVCT